ncbi:MAG: metalloregulator ArsR/SmtB family transcription factor [Candidatus Gastranaerophilales bacterium]|nr:metalloregulator ArsR/SmtB family transcription factor [Candidatus Gastranaerophilales bacterium]
MKGHAEQFNALSDELRLNILLFLYKNKEQCVCNLCEKFHINQSAISYHLKILTDLEFLNKRKEAVWNYYSVNKTHILYPILRKIFKKENG